MPGTGRAGRGVGRVVIGRRQGSNKNLLTHGEQAGMSQCHSSAWHKMVDVPVEAELHSQFDWCRDWVDVQPPLGLGSVV